MPHVAIWLFYFMVYVFRILQLKYQVSNVCVSAMQGACTLTLPSTDAKPVVVSVLRGASLVVSSCPICVRNWLVSSPFHNGQVSWRYPAFTLSVGLSSMFQNKHAFTESRSYKPPSQLALFSFFFLVYRCFPEVFSLQHLVLLHDFKNLEDQCQG